MDESLRMQKREIRKADLAARCKRVKVKFPGYGLAVCEMWSPTELQSLQCNMRGIRRGMEIKMEIKQIVLQLH